MKAYFQKHQALIFGVLILVVSYFTYFHNYTNPAAFFWDENYHVTHAQKYINGIYFMHEHPPLGKMLMALGEYTLRANAVNDQFIGTDYSTDLPENFSFAGYRFFSVFLSWMAALVFYAIFLLITKRPLWATLLSMFYIFDNATILQGRGAMLDGPLLFFGALTILCFFLALHWKDHKRFFHFALACFGIAFACALLTKFVGLIYIVLLIPLLWFLRHDRRKLLDVLIWVSIAFVITFVAIWQIHFALGRTVQPSLRNDGYYEASPVYRSLIETNRHTSILAFPIALVDSLRYPGIYDEGMPELNLCKPDENGSPVWFWPFGARSINYRWETDDGEHFRYWTLIANPVIWWTVFLGVILSLSLFLSRILTPLKHPIESPVLLFTFLAMYCAYMVKLSSMDRVLFLYHYLPPLHIAFIIFAIWFCGIRQIFNIKLTETRKTFLLFVLGVLIFSSYQFYKPLTYGGPLTDKQLEQRGTIQLWELNCANCTRESVIATPLPLDS